VSTIDVLQRLKETLIDYSICTLVNNHREYNQMVCSFRKKGFIEPRCEFLYIDNSRKNEHDGFSGLNLFLRAAKGKHIIICHQDIELINDDIDKLDDRLSELDKIDQKWAVAGNAGGKYKSNLGELAIRITDPHGADVSRGPFPSRVTSLDENFILVKAGANLALSGNLSGFHLYATDLCIIASILGYNTYVIDFHLNHKSPGKLRKGKELLDGEKEFDEIKEIMTEKYSVAFSPQWYSSSTTEVFIIPKILLDFKYNFRCIAEKSYQSISSFFRQFKMNLTEYIFNKRVTSIFSIKRIKNTNMIKKPQGLEHSRASQPSGLESGPETPAKMCATPTTPLDCHAHP
jgi:hypothetical protein